MCGKPDAVPLNFRFTTIFPVSSTRTSVEEEEDDEEEQEDEKDEEMKMSEEGKQNHIPIDTLSAS